MKSPPSLTIVILLILITLANPTLAEPQTDPIASRVYWLTIHTRTPEAFDSLHALFTRDLQLPVFFGPETHGQRRYLAVLAGHVILETCGPFPDSPYPDAKTLARVHSLFLRPHTSLAASATALASRQIQHDPPKTVPWDPTELHIKLTALSAPGMPVTLSERVKDPAALNAQFDSLRKDHAARNAGPLSIRDLDEVHIGYSDENRLAKWQSFLHPIHPTARLWRLTEKPALCFVPHNHDEIVALVFKVESLDQAVRQLKAMNLVGTTRQTTASIAPSRACGLKILLKE